MGAKKLRVQFTGTTYSPSKFILRVKYDGVIILFIDAVYGVDLPAFPNPISSNPNLSALALKSYIDSQIILQDAQSVLTEVITDSLYITIGTNIIDTIGEFLNGSSWVTVGSYYLGTFYSYLSQEPYTYPSPDQIVLDEKIILSRSPYFFNATSGVAYDNITASIYIYKGEKVSDIPAVETFNLSKSVVQAGQQTIGFNISALVNDFVKNNINVIPSAGAFTTSDSDTIWCYVDASINLGAVSVYTVQQTVLAVDGFGWHTELANPIINQNILTTELNHIVFPNNDYPIYFKTENLTDIEINGVTVPFTFNPDYNNQVIGVVNIASYIDTNETFTAVFTYGAVVETLNFKVETECKYPIVNCIFKNKFGFWQSIAFNKLSKSAVNTEGETYQSIISNSGAYQLNNHVFKTFGVVETETITVNTGFVDESYNSKFKELLASEFIYLVEDGQTLPVNLVKKSIEKQTKLINKLIQFTMDFKYSFNSINEII